MMIPSLLPQKPEDPSHHTTVRIGVGIYGASDEAIKSNMGGKFPDVRLYDKRGDYIGRNKGNFPHLDTGGFKEVTIPHEKGTDGRQAEYIALSSSSDDALCINYVTTTWPDGSSMGFLGDVGSMCGANWYYSDVIVTNYDSSTSEAPQVLNRTSNCMWIDRDHTNGIPHAGFSFHVVDFSSSTDKDNDGRAKQYHDDKDTMCTSAPRFKMYEQMDKETDIAIFWPALEYTDDNADADLEKVKNNPGKVISKRKRDVVMRDEGIPEDDPNNQDKRQEAIPEDDPNNQDKRDEPIPEDDPNNQDKRSTIRRRSPKVAGTVVKSSIDQHNASQLCKAPNSYGPDFVSLVEGVFCDMDKKEVWPLCSGTQPYACFDVAKNEMRAAPHGRRSLNGRDIPHKAYDLELNWGSK
jgi:hypothetical protein